MDKHVATLKKMLQTRAVAGDESHAALKSCAEEVFLKAAKTCHNIDIRMLEVGINRLTRKGVMDALPAVALTVMLYKGVGATGLVMLDGPMIDALIEQQTLGRVDTGKRIERPVTRIDAALSEAFIDSVLAHLVDILGAQGPGARFVGYTRGVAQMDRAALSLALGAAEYDVFTVDLDLGPGAKTGCFQLFFPSDATVRLAAQPGEAAEISPAIAAAPVRLRVNLPPIQVSLAALSRLVPGSKLPVARAALSQAALCDAGGTQVLSGRLGQLDGKRAVRICHDVVEPNASSAMNATAPMDLSVPEATPEISPDAASMGGLGAMPPAMDAAQAEEIDLPDLDITGDMPPSDPDPHMAALDTELPPLTETGTEAAINFADVDLSAFSSAD